MSTELITAISSAAGALASLVVAIASLIKAHKANEMLEKAKLRETYGVCPHCKKKIPLSQISFYLPDGSLDNNLDGLPDVKQ